MSQLLDQFYEFFSKNREMVTGAGQVVLKTGLTLLTAYLAASTATSFSIVFLAKSAMEPKSGAPLGGRLSSADISSNINYTDLRRDVVERNIFNSDGEVPEDEPPPGQEGGGGGSEFNANDVCHKSPLELTLVGTIYLGETGDSLATIREKGYNEADVYQKGDAIIGHEQATVYDILPQKVVLNNNGVKECLEVVENKANTYGPPSPSGPTGVAGNSGSTGPGAGGSSNFTLEAQFVEESLGPGFAKILEVGRLVPHPGEDGQLLGFKLVGVKAGSLWRRIGLNSGDVITKVNDLSMAQPEQGFALYQALQDSREIRVEYLKRGKDPATMTVEIK